MAGSAAAHPDALIDATLSGETFIDFTNLDQTKNGSDTATPAPAWTSSAFT